MVNLIKRILIKIGIDGAIGFTIFARVIQALGGIITLFFVAKCLSKVEQGYYYTFGSVLAIQIFFELGLSGIITQFVAHENAKLIWHDRFSFTGSEESCSRLASLLRFGVKWFIVISFFLFIVLLVTGYLFFNKFGKEHVNWQLPWVILSIVTSLSLLFSPILAFFEGLGLIKEIAKIRLIQQIVQLLMVFLFFLSGYKLYSIPLGASIGLLIIPTWIFVGSKIRLLKFVWSKIGSELVSYQNEIFPFQWKIALSWISGFFIFQLFNPVLFATEGAVVAGQMGMTLAVLNGISSVSMSWISTKVPLFSNLIALKKYNYLDKLFNKTLYQLCIICIVSLAIFICTVLFLNCINSILFERFLSPYFIILLSICFLVNQIVGSWATYLRCHKEEPYLILSIVMGLLNLISTFVLGNYFGIGGIIYGYSFITIFVSLFWGNYIFKNKKEEWHK